MLDNQGRRVLNFRTECHKCGGGTGQQYACSCAVLANPNPHLDGLGFCNTCAKPVVLAHCVDGVCDVCYHAAEGHPPYRHNGVPMPQQSDAMAYWANPTTDAAAVTKVLDRREPWAAEYVTKPSESK